ncbi:MAG: protein phosphatase 2C domain-containing protein [Pseudomonadota bacterium]
MDFAICSWPGKREDQQDAVVTVRLESRALTVIADGVGGSEYGGIASRLAVDEFACAELESESDNPIKRLEQSLKHTNEAIERLKQAQPQYADMATTLTAARIQKGMLWWISVGDSPLYLVTKTGLCRLNEDHSVGGSLDAMARKGFMTEKEAKSDPARHQLTSALSGTDIPFVDCPNRGLPIANGQQILIGSDGMKSLSPDEVFDAIVSDPNPQSAVDSILSKLKALNRPDQDNVTLALSSKIRAPWHHGLRQYLQMRAAGVSRFR